MVTSRLSLWNSPWNTVKPYKELAEKSQRQMALSSGSLSGHLEEVWEEWRVREEAITGMSQECEATLVWVSHFGGYEK